MKILSPKELQEIILEKESLEEQTKLEYIVGHITSHLNIRKQYKPGLRISCNIQGTMPSEKVIQNLKTLYEDSGWINFSITNNSDGAYNYYLVSFYAPELLQENFSTVLP